MRTYNENISPLRQSAKQRRSSEIAEQKFTKRCPMSETNRYVQLKKSPFGQDIIMNRFLMKYGSFTNPNNIHDYTSTMYQVKRAA